jgi:hypothetical protein
MINLRHLVAIVTLAGTAGLAAPSSATAHATCASYGANVACVGASHHLINWCDHESDGHRVFAQYYVDESTVVTTGVTASSGRCRHQSEARGIAKFRVCEIGSACGA